MSEKKNDPRQTPADTVELRKRAEEKAGVMEPISLSGQPPEELQQKLHELRVHQIELEMQNEELRKAQEEIEESRARYFDLYDLAPVGYCTLSEKGLIQEANLTAATMLGVNRAALVKEPISRFILKEDQDNYYLHHKKLFKTGEAQECELRLLKPDGRFFWGHLTETAAQAEDGAPVCRVVLIDITERKQAEEALRHRLIYEQMLSRISTMAVQYEGLERFLNDSLTILGETLDISRVYLFEYHHETDSLDNTVEWCAPEEAPQKNALQDVPAATIPWWMAVLKDGGTICFSDIEDIPDEGVKEILRPQAICSIVAVPLFVNGRFHGFMGFDECRFYREWLEEDVEILLTISRIIAGVVYKELSEEERERERQQLLSIFNSIEEIIYISDPETYEILYVNPKLANILQRDCVGGLCYKEFQGFDEPCAFCTNDIILKQQPQPHYWEYYNPKLEQHLFIVDRIIEWPDGRKVRFEMATDVTERKRAEAEKEKLESQLRQAQKMESVGRLAGGVAHDFNNMLTIINGYAEMMTGVLSPSDPMHESAREIHDAGKRSAVIVRKLLAFARKQTISPEIMNLNDNVASMLKMLQHLIGENIDLVWKPAQNLWLIKMDFSQLDQIVANLVVNARDAIADIGKITIETENVEFDEQYCDSHTGFVPGQFVMLSISDTGCGMTKEVFDNLFEPFFTTKEIGKGTGLGLPTVYGIVKQNNGFINVYSEPEQGTTISIYLPRHVGEAVDSGREDQEQYPLGNGETILVVEDEVPVLNLTKIMLEKLGYKVLASNSAHEALALIKSYGGAIDLIITDVIMPEMNGRDFATQVNSLYPDMKTLFMSGYTADVIVRHGILEKGLRYIQKPFSIKDLAIKVQKAIEEENE
ncbi:MAG: ATP-binding protein [Desulfovermiculus sp.]|nr:ATP-binding protein [Desulfovermiculus sp.]